MITDDFDRAETADLGSEWTFTYSANGTMQTPGETALWVQTPKSPGEMTYVTIVCRVCGREVTVTETIHWGDPRLCEHMGGPAMDEANWVAGKGWGGKSHLFDDWSNDDYSDLANDPILLAELAEDAKLDDPDVFGRTER